MLTAASARLSRELLCILYLQVCVFQSVKGWFPCRTFFLPYLHKSLFLFSGISSMFLIPVFIILLPSLDSKHRCVYKDKVFITWVMQRGHFWKSNSCVSWLNELWTLLRTWVITLAGKHWVPFRTWRKSGIEEKKWELLHEKNSISWSWSLLFSSWGLKEKDKNKWKREDQSENYHPAHECESCATDWLTFFLISSIFQSYLYEGVTLVSIE